MRTIATLSEAVATLLLLHLCGCRSANDCELGGKDAVICALCSDTTAGVRWTASSPRVRSIALTYNCSSSQGREILLNDTCFKGREIPDPHTLRHGSESDIVGLFHMVDSTLSPGTQCTFSGGYEVEGGLVRLQPTTCTIKTTTECQEYPPSCQLPATCVSDGDRCNCHCNEGFFGHNVESFSAAHCNNIDECLTEADNNCSVNAVCTDTVGGYNCTCTTGYEGDGFTCSSNRVSIPPSAPAGSSPTSTVLPIPTGTGRLLPSENPLRDSTLQDTYSMTTLIQPSVTATPFLEMTQIQVGSDAVPTAPAVLTAAVAVVCVAALLIFVTLTVALIALRRNRTACFNRYKSNRFYGLKFTDVLDPNFQPVKINETPCSLGSLHSIFHTLHPHTGHDSVSISKSVDIMEATSTGIAQCGKISQMQSSSELLEVKTEDLSIQNAEKASLISRKEKESLMGSTGSIELGCLTEIAQSGSNVSLRMSSYVEEKAAQPLATPMQHPSSGYVQDNDIDQVTALPMTSISTNSPALRQVQENPFGENQSTTNHQMNFISGDYVQDDNNNGGNGAHIEDDMNFGLEASGDTELGCLDLEGEGNDEISLSTLDNIVTDNVKMHSNTLTMQISSQGYMQESDAATFPVQRCIDNHGTQIHSEGEYEGDNSLQHSSNDGIQTNHQPAEDVCTQSFTSGYTLTSQGDHFKGKPGDVRSSEREHAECEVPLSALEFTNTGADGYVQQNEDKILQLPPSSSTGTRHDPNCIGFHTDCNTTANTYSAATPLATTMQHPSLGYVQDSNIERISKNSPALQQAQENTSGENQSKTNHRTNCTSGDYVCDATQYTSSGGNGAYIKNATSIGLEASGDMEIGCIELEGEANDEILLSLLDMTEMHSNPLPMQNSTQGYMEESDAATFPLPGEHSIFNDRPVGLKSSEGEHAVCEVPLSTLQYTNTGADGYVQQNKDKTPHNLYSAATPLATTIQHPSLGHVQDSNIERISTNSPALQQAQENTSGENQSKMDPRMNCTSGDYVHDATEYTSSSGNGAYIRDAMSVGLKASGDVELGCLGLEKEANDEISLSMLDMMTEMHSNPLPMLNSSQDYMEESDAATFPLPGEYNCCDKPVGLKSSGSADGYVQQNKDETPQLQSPLSTGTSHDQNCIGFHTECNSTNNMYSAAIAATDYTQENTPLFSSSNVGGYIQNATAFPPVKMSLSVDSGSEEFPLETLLMSDVSEAEEIQARTGSNSTMQNDVQNTNHKSYQTVPSTLPPTEHSARLSSADSPMSHTKPPPVREMSLSSGYITQSSTDGSVFDRTPWDPDPDLENMVDLESQDYSAIATENSWVVQDSSYISPFPETNQCISSHSVSSPEVTLPSTPETQMSTGSNREPVLDFSQPTLPAICPHTVGYRSDQSTPKSVKSGPSSSNRGYTLPSLLTHQYAENIEHQPEPITHSLDLLPVSGGLPFKQSHMSRPNIQELEQRLGSDANSHSSAGEYQNTAMTDSRPPSTDSRHFVPSLLTHLYPGTIDQPLKLPSTESLDPFSVPGNSPLVYSHMSRLNRQLTPEFDLCSISNANSCPPASDYIPGSDQCSVSNPVSEYQNTAMKPHPDPPGMDSQHFVPSSLTKLHHGTTERPPIFSADSLPVPRKLTHVSGTNSPDFEQCSISNANSCQLAAEHQTNTRTLDPDPPRTESRCLLPSLLTHLHPGTAETWTDTSAHSTDATSFSVNCSQIHPSSLPAVMLDGYIGAPSFENRLQHSQNSVHNSIIFPESKAVGHAIANTDYVDIESWPLPTFAC